MAGIIKESDVKNLVTDLAAKEVSSNKSDDTTLASSSSTLYPTQNAVKVYVDTAISNQVKKTVIGSFQSII